ARPPGRRLPAAVVLTAHGGELPGPGEHIQLRSHRRPAQRRFFACLAARRRASRLAPPCGAVAVPVACCADPPEEAAPRAAAAESPSTLGAEYRNPVARSGWPSPNGSSIGGACCGIAFFPARRPPAG